MPVPKEEIRSAELIVIAQDVDTDEKGNRLFSTVHSYIELVHGWTTKPIVLQSQVSPAFCKRLGMATVFYQPEALRILDATDRAYAPECIVVGCYDKTQPLPAAYQTYLDAFQCPIVKSDYESAEFTKIAINMYLASQVDTTNRLAEAAEACGADWEAVKLAVGYDKRIGTYTTPGSWQDSIHLLRDYVTLKEIEDAL